MSFPQLETARLLLTEVNEENASSMFEIFSNPDVVKYYGMDAFETVEQAQGMVKHFRQGFEAKRSMRWGMIMKETNQFIGTIGLNLLNLTSKKAEIGFEIHPDYWRNGYTYEAAIAVLEYSFKELQLQRLGAVTFVDNTASQGLLKKIGFQYEGTLRNYLFQNNQVYDGLLFSILPSEWENRR
ncbi:GNAT family N-acetyltransferase [Chungangia koreensis]|uniref:GNAT family N-acetyltransferase n=1 Tax=Chungangia koreensis TaxID=752657 RepID=A0ABV8X2S9_9LACT